MNLRVGIIGSREYRNLENVEKIISYLLDTNRELIIVSGGARGVDSKAREVCYKYNIKYIEYKPDFKNGYDVRKYHERNDKIINNSDIIIAFWNGRSRGTKSVIDKASNKKYVFVFYDKPITYQDRSIEEGMKVMIMRSVM